MRRHRRRGRRGTFLDDVFMRFSRYVLDGRWHTDRRGRSWWKPASVEMMRADRKRRADALYKPAEWVKAWKRNGMAGYLAATAAPPPAAT